MTRTGHCGFFLVFLGLSLCVACNHSSAPQAPASNRPAVKAAPVDAAVAATISGTVSFDGTPPTPKHIDMSNDPGCKGNAASEQILVDDGHLANVLVYVKDGLGNLAFDPSNQVVTIRQEGCRYVPHVAAVMTGQVVRFEDNDPTLHNIHSMPRQNREWNQSQMPNSQPIDKTFTAPELMIPVKCNQHPWMQMYISVLGNPFFAVTGQDGKFSLQGLPPGTYTIAAVQEKYGEKTQVLTVGARENKTISFNYQP
ncbi:MAG: carboxypeptidase regulatory-like domain-containing protein [Candidatus Korobacteraceae bacterium]